MAYFVFPTGTPSHNTELEAKSDSGPIPTGQTITWRQDGVTLKTGSTSDAAMLLINTGDVGDVAFDASDTGTTIDFLINATASSPVILSNTTPTITGAGPVTDAYNRTTGRPTFNWSYQDADGDEQYMFRVRVGSTLGGSEYLDATLFSSAETFTYPLATAAVPAGATYYWTIDVTDGEKVNPLDPDVPEPARVVASASGTCVVNTAPVSSAVLVEGTSGGATITPKRPIVSWNYADVDSQPQAAYRIVFSSTPDLSGTIYWDSGRVSGTATSAQYNFNGTGVVLPSHTLVYAGVSVYDTFEASDFAFESFIISNKPVLTSVAIDDRINPTNISSERPRFTWIHSDPDGDNLTSFEIRVGTSSSLLGTNAYVGDVWDTGQYMLPGAHEAEFDFDGGATPGYFLPATHYFQIRVTDAYETSDWYTGFFKTNTPPTASNLSIVPPAPFHNEDLKGTYDFVDDVGETSSSQTQIKWYQNGVEVESLRNLTVAPSALLVPGDSWYFTVLPHDGTEYGSLATSPTVTILNRPPQATALSVLPPRPSTGDDLEAAFAVSDPDEDDVQVTIRWYKNGVEQSELLNSKFVPASMTSIDDEWHFSVLPTDGYATGALATSSTVKILNTRPRITSMKVDNRILPSDVQNANPVISWEYQDDDSQPQEKYQLVIGTRPLRTQGPAASDAGSVAGSNLDGIIATAGQGVVVSGDDVYDSLVVDSAATSAQYATADFLPETSLSAAAFQSTPSYGLAPDGRNIRLATGKQTGTVSGKFPGTQGLFDVVLAYNADPARRSVYKVLVDNVLLGQFTSGLGSGTKEASIGSIRLAPGAVVSVVGSAADAGAKAEFSVLKFVPILQLDLRAANFQVLSGYVPDGDGGVKLAGLAGSASTPFPFPSGKYDIELQYQTESVGNPTLAVSVNNLTVLSFVYESGLKTRSKFVRDVTLTKGDTIKIMGTRNGGAQARVAKVVFRPVDTVQTGAKLRDGFRYFASVRVFDGREWSDWHTTRFTMNGSAWVSGVSNSTGWTIEAKFKVVKETSEGQQNG
jgi:hypothetical protein